MNRFTLICRSLSGFGRSHLAVAAGLSVAAVVLVGALVVGDSVDHTLEQAALSRTGRAHLALIGNEHFFRDTLAADLAGETGVTTTPVLLLNGSVSIPDTGRRAARVQIVGVKRDFFNFAPEPGTRPAFTGTRALANGRLAKQLDLHGSSGTLVVRIDTPHAIPRDAMLVSEDTMQTALRLDLAGTLSDADFGRFSLQAEQAAPYTLFIPLQTLQQRTALEGRANVILTGDGLTSPDLADALRETWTLADAGLSLVPLAGGRGRELRSTAVFLHPHSERSAMAAHSAATPVLSYFVNALSRGDASTPYSLVSAVPDGTWGLSLPAGSAAVSQWLAEDLGLAVGDRFDCRYYAMGAMRRLEEKTGAFTVNRILPMDSPALDPQLMPDIPGLTGSASCRDWAPGFSVDLSTIRPADEAYWDRFKGAPKAVIGLADGQSLWKNRYGRVTAVRYPPPQAGEADLSVTIARGQDPLHLGIQILALRESALRAGRDAMDFGAMFLFFSSFLVAAALLLAALLCTFHIEQRAAETGLLAATGFTRPAIRNLFLAEGAVLSLAAGLAGILLGTGYTRLLLSRLATSWRSAIGNAELLYHATPQTLLTGGAAAAVIGVLTTGLVLRSQLSRSPIALLKGAHPADASPRDPGTRLRLVLLPLGALGGAALCAWKGAQADIASQGPRFFTAGLLFLVALILTLQAVLIRMGTRPGTPRMHRSKLTLRNTARKRGRSLATTALVACGCFMTVAVSAHRLDAGAGSIEKQSGTGGFSHVAQLASPVFRDLNSPVARKQYGLDGLAGATVSFVPLREQPGDEASCLNLNRPQRPRIWGVSPALLTGRFTFIPAAGTRTRSQPPPANTRWAELDLDLGPGKIPAIGDRNSMMWSLGLQPGQSFNTVDVNGASLELVLVAELNQSILQGGLLVSEENFLKHFSRGDGYRFLLAEVPPHSHAAFEKVMHAGLRDHGLELRAAVDRLADFNGLQNTYLAIFQTLGAFGLLLGSAGLGLVVLRNVYERRTELAMLRAVGFSRSALLRMVIGEHLVLLFAGTFAGCAAAVVALLPALQHDPASLPLPFLAAVLAGVLINGLAWTVLAALQAMRGPLIPALRNE